MKVRATCHNLKISRQIDFPNWPDGNPCHFCHAKNMSQPEQAPMTDNARAVRAYVGTISNKAQLSAGWQYEAGTKLLNHVAINRLI
jgi:hypothetical protein